MKMLDLFLSLKFAVRRSVDKVRGRLTLENFSDVKREFIGRKKFLKVKRLRARVQIFV